MTKRNQLLFRQVWFFLSAGVVVAFDQIAKHWAIEELTPGTSVSFIGELIKLNLVFNDSAAFSIGFGATWVFTIISALAALAVVLYSARIKTLGWSVMAGIFLGGVSGNLFDRLFREPGFANGYVVDYIQIPFDFPIFNIADIAIFCICALSVIRIMRGDQLGGSSISK